MQTRLREWRETRGLSLRKLGGLSGVHYVSLVKLEAGRLDPQLSTLLKLCQALRVSLSQLVGERINKGGK
jgi:transcriptional regulator with XRE-family HTH domain